MAGMLSARGALLGLAACLPAAALALDYRSLAEAGVMYDAPSKQAKPRFVVARATPVEVVVSVEGWSKVRDSAGDIAWVEARLLEPRRTVIVTVQRAAVRREPQPEAPLVFEAERDVLLELDAGAPAGWAKVRHRDGQGGYVRVNQIWGL